MDSAIGIHSLPKLPAPTKPKVFPEESMVRVYTKSTLKVSYPLKNLKSLKSFDFRIAEIDMLQIFAG